MSKFKSGKRYADVLTVLLVIVIIGIIALLCYFGYKAIAKRNTESDAADAVDEFYKTREKDENEVENETSTGSLDDLLANVNTTDNSDSAASGRTKVYLGEYEVKGTIQIPKTKIEYPILEKATVGALNKGIGLMTVATSDEITSTVNELNVPGTNAYLLGHNYRNGQFFSKNDQLQLGDTINITDSAGNTVSYTIYKMYYTSPDDVSFMERELDPETREISVQTCNNDSSQRLLIWAKDR